MEIEDVPIDGEELLKAGSRDENQRAPNLSPKIKPIDSEAGGMDPAGCGKSGAAGTQGAGHLGSDREDGSECAAAADQKRENRGTGYCHSTGPLHFQNSILFTASD
jgi:hypothetical protein